MDYINGNNLLTIGIQYHPVRGGVAAVISSYSKMIKPFHFIGTVNDSNKLFKLIVFIKALFVFMYYMLVKHNIKIVHIHGASYVSFWRKSVFILLGKAFGKKIVYHIHGGGFKKFSKEHPNAVRYVLSKTDCIIALSENWKEFFEKEFSCKKVTVISNIIEAPQINPKKSNLFTLLFLGKMNKNKGIYDLLDVIIKNKSEYKNKLRLFLGGNGEIESVQRKIHENGIENIVIFKGWVSGNSKIDLFNQSDVYILPSYYEGLPISILEAMSYSMPIIATNVGGIPEIVENGINGYLINPGNKEAIENAINKFLFNPSLIKSMGEKSQQKIKKHLPVEVSKELSQLYNTI